MSESVKVKGIAFVYCHACDQLHFSMFAEATHMIEPIAEASINMANVEAFIDALVNGFVAYHGGVVDEGASESCTKH